MYILVDPIILYIPTSEKSTREEFLKFIDMLLDWGKYLRNDNLKLRLSKRCNSALAASDGYPLKGEFLQGLLDRHHLDYNRHTLIDMISPFFNKIFSEPFIEDAYINIRDQLAWQFDDVVIYPDEFLSRIPDDKLRNAFKDTLIDITAARQNTSQAIMHFSASHIATQPYGNGGHDLKVAAKMKVLDVIHEEELEDTIEAKYTLISDPQDTIEYYRDQLEFDTVAQAVEFIGSNYHPSIIISRQASKTAQASNYNNPKEIYDLLVGLLEVWLPAYCRGGDDGARDAFYDKYSRWYVRDESETVKNQFSSDYTVSYGGQNIFCGKHIKIGIGSQCVRINFELIKSDGEDHIIVARVGSHGRNTRS